MIVFVPSPITVHFEESKVGEYNADPEHVLSSRPEAPHFTCNISHRTILSRHPEAYSEDHRSLENTVSDPCPEPQGAEVQILKANSVETRSF